jgi:gamma-glutamylaminecyclotransferase
VSRQGLSRLDELEGTSRDHYERLPIRVEPIDGGDVVFGVETYYGHRSYGLKLLFFNKVLSICNSAALTAMYI